MKLLIVLLNKDSAFTLLGSCRLVPSTARIAENKRS